MPRGGLSEGDGSTDVRDRATRRADARRGVRVASLEAELDLRERREEALREEVAALEREIASLEADVESLETEVERRRRERRNLVDRYEDALATRTAAHRARIEALEEERRARASGVASRLLEWLRGFGSSARG